jgi:hypothetical protein
MQLDFRRPPLYHFRKQIRRLRIIEQIKNDFNEQETDKYGYKNALMNQFFVVHLVAMLQAHLQYLVSYHYEDPKSVLKRSKLTYCNKRQYKKAINNFGSPSKNKINDLFRIVFMKKNVMASVCAGTLSNAETLAVLKEILTCRHKFAHTGMNNGAPINNDKVQSYRNFVIEFAESFDEVVITALYSSND